MPSFRVQSAYVVTLLTVAIAGFWVPQARGQSCLRGFEGVWKTNYGNLTLSVQGNRASGTYGSDRMVSGTISGNVLDGEWRYPNGRWGRLRFVHDGNGGFAGNWGRTDGALTTAWTGTCSTSGPTSGGGVSPGAGPGPGTAGPGGGVLGGSGSGCAQGFAGTWKTNYGNLTMSVRGNQASGSYGSGRTVSGTIAGNVFTGRWQYPNGRWGRVRFVHDGNGGFAGNWGRTDGALTTGWTGTCSTSGPTSGGGAGGFSGMCAAVSGAGGTGVCADPRVEQLMNDWLSRAIPTQSPGSNLRYDCWGRAVGQAATGTITANQNPDTDGRLRCNYLLDHSHLYTSTNMGTMRQYLDSNLR